MHIKKGNTVGSFTMTNIQTSVLLGTLIGDGHIQKVQSSSGKCRLRISHSANQKDYVDWKYQIFQDLPCSEPQIDQKNQISFYSLYSQDMQKYHDLFYKENALMRYRKGITDQITIDAISLAVWYMDDGRKRDDCDQCRFATHNYSLAEVKILQSLLQQNFCLPSSIVKAGKSKVGQHQWYVLAISAKNFHILQSIIASFIKQEVPSMYYKIKPRND